MLGIMSFGKRISLPNIGFLRNGNSLHITCHIILLGFFILIHKRSVYFFRQTIVFDLRQDFLNLPFTGIKAVKILIGIPVPSHIHELVVFDGIFQSAHISQNIGNRGLFQNFFGYSLRLFLTPLIGLVGLVDFKSPLRRFSNAVRICHIILRYFGRDLTIAYFGKIFFSNHFNNLLTVIYNMVANQIHIAAILPKRIKSALGV